MGTTAGHRDSLSLTVGFVFTYYLNLWIFKRSGSPCHGGEPIPDESIR
jgi:hypothetical protein